VINLAAPKTFQFYKLLPDGRYEFFVDASLLKDFSICERLFWMKHIRNLKQKGELIARPFSMAIGSWWSDVMERFYDYMKEGKSITNDDIVKFATEAWAENSIEASAKANPKQYEAFGDLAGAVLMLKEYYDRQYLSDMSSWKVVSVEQGFGLKREVKLGETARAIVYWIGKPDLVVVEQGRIMPIDHKTVDRVDNRTVSLYKPSDQMPGYVLSCEVIANSVGIPARVDRCVVNICGRSRPTDNPRNGKKQPRFIRAYPNFTREETEEWRQDVLRTCDRLAYCITHQDFLWKKTSCHSVYHRDCEYLQIDSITPSARETIIKAHYQARTPWVPYKVREEEE
jgi:hypothetical protein